MENLKVRGLRIYEWVKRALMVASTMPFHGNMIEIKDILLMGQILAVSWGPQLIKLIKCFCFLAFLLSLGNGGEMVKEKSRMAMKGIQYNH